MGETGENRWVIDQVMIRGGNRPGVVTGDE
jgi:hypothetical protein